MAVNNNELLPCPFCGGKAKWKGYYTGSTPGLVECTGCAACTHGGNWEKAKEQWNARAERACTMKQDGMFLVCSECGTVLMGNPRYCSGCGARVLSEEEQGHMVADAIRRLEKAVEG